MRILEIFIDCCVAIVVAVVLYAAATAPRPLAEKITENIEEIQRENCDCH